MSVFEDLIDELKNENLLEDTVINQSRADAAARDDGQAVPDGKPALVGSAPGPTAVESGFEAEIPRIEKPSSDQEFFRKRAMDEVSSLQMVEHVFCGVEREHMKVSPSPYDGLNAKKALHRFIQDSEDPRSAEHAEAEFAFRQETEAWNFALYSRDQKVSVANIRRFCEESRPVLSSQALIALARFYRNSPYSEDARGKFDYVMTRLFTRESGEETRQPLFEHAEMIGHINTLYANWSSIALYTSRDDQVEVSLTITRFDEFRIEIENAESFDELLESDFFNRVRVYKEESSEMFYVPEVVAAAIRCNLAIGNRYVQLIARERFKQGSARIEEKYGADYDQVVSNAAGRTLLLSDVLTVEIDGLENDGPERSERSAKPPVVPTKTRSRREESEDSGFDLFGVNKWVMVLCMALILLGGGVYIWAEKVAGGGGEAMLAKPVEIEDPQIKKFLRSPRLASDTLFAVAEPTFEALTEEERKTVLGKVLEFAQTQNLQKVSLLNNDGRAVAFASKDRMELMSH